MLAATLYSFSFAPTPCTDDNAAVPMLATALGVPDVTSCAEVPFSRRFHL